MALVPMSVCLSEAKKAGLGVPAFNMFNMESILWPIQVAEELGQPVIVQLYPGFCSPSDATIIAAIAREAAGKVRVPVALHIDHSRDLDTILGLIRHFPSVMIDMSAEPYEKNVEVTREVARIAHAMGVEVEAELGHVGSGAKIEDFGSADTYTDPAQAAEFVERTGCDFLAVAIGNGHGQYVAAPQFDFDRLVEIRKAVSIPLVLHGGSGTPDDQFSRCVELGMLKFNVFTDVNRALGAHMRDALTDKGKQGLFESFKTIEAGVKDVYRHKFVTLNPKGVKVV